MKGLRYYISLLLLWTVGLTLTAQNNTPTFVVDYKNSESTTVTQSGIGFASNADGTQYSISNNGQYQENLNLSKVKSISRYYEPPVTHVYSDESTSEAIVKEVREDGTVVLDAATAKEIPQVGEIIISGVTDAAPYGFLYHVEGVEKKNGQIVLKTSPASLNEVLPDVHIETPLPMGQAVQEQNAPSRIAGMNSDKDFELLNKTWDFYIEKELKKDVKIKGDIKLGFEIGGTLYYDTKYGITQRCGVKVDGSAFLKTVVELSAKAKTGELSANVWDQGLATITLWIGPIPVCLTPHIVVDGVFEAEAGLYLKWTPFDAKWKCDAHVIWNKEPNNLGENWDWGAHCDNPLGKSFWKNLWSLDDLTDFEAGMSGEVKLSFVPKLELRLFNQENVRVDIGLAPYAKAEGELALKYQHDKGTWDDVELKDNLSFSVGMEFPLEGKMEFKIPFTDNVLGGMKQKKIKIFEVPLFQGATFFPVYNDFTIYPEDNAKEFPNVHVSAKKGFQVFSFLSGDERDYGFCYAPLHKDQDGNEVPGEWVYLSMRDKYHNLYELGSEFEMETDIPTFNLEDGCTYEVRPYTDVGKWGVVKRKGGKFKTGGVIGDGGGVIIDIPGENL